MTFLTPWAAITAAIVAIPLLLLLYFLKLRRQPRRVASTLLWMKSVEDLQVNAPFQRLRFTILFLLQLIILILLILALGRPVIRADAGVTDRMILLIDRSASMNATDVGPDGRSRLEAAKDAARDLISRLGRTERSSQLLIIAFGRTAQVVWPFESDRRTLQEAIDSIEPTDESADFSAALQLADAFAGGGDEADAALPVVVLISDGAVGEPASASPRAARFVRASEFRFIRVGSDDPSNVGIVSMTGRRRIDDATRIDVFLRLLNVAPRSVETTITMYLDGRIHATRRVTVPAIEETEDDDHNARSAFSFEIPLSEGGVITVSQDSSDSLAADDFASIVVAPPRSPRIVIVSEGEPDRFVVALLEALEPEELQTVRLDQFLEMSGLRETSGPFPFDFAAFDSVWAPSLPDVPTLAFGAAPPGVDIDEPSRPGARRFASWDRRHPIMRHVELDEIVFSEFGAYRIPREERDDWTVLASGPDGAVILLDQQSRVPHVFVGFDLIHSNWPTSVGLLIFLQNILDQRLGRGAEDAIRYAPGEAISVRPEPGQETLTIRGPQTMFVEVDDRDEVPLPILRSAGLYFVDGAVPPDDTIAVNLTDPNESDIRPRESVSVNARSVRGGGVGEAVSRELWPWLVAAAFAVLMVEWLVFARRARG